MPRRCIASWRGDQRALKHGFSDGHAFNGALNGKAVCWWLRYGHVHVCRTWREQVGDIDPEMGGNLVQPAGADPVYPPLILLLLLERDTQLFS